MPNASASQNKLTLRWSAAANRSLTSTLRRVGSQDAAAAIAMLQRVERALAVLLVQPGIGTPTASKLVRRYPIPNTGHTIDYAVMKGQLEVRRWFRQRRQVPP